MKVNEWRFGLRILGSCGGFLGRESRYIFLGLEVLGGIEGF